MATAAVGVMLAAVCVTSGRVDAPNTATAPSPQARIDTGTMPYTTPGTDDSAAAVPSGAATAVTAAVTAADDVVSGRSDVTLAVAVADRATGEFVGSMSGTEPMYAASLVKIIIAVDVLQRRRSGLAVDAEDVALIRRALGPSDDQAMNLLWTRFDGPAAVSRVARQLGLSATRPPVDPSQWGESLVSAHDMVLLYRHVLGELPPWDRELIMTALATAPPVAADGFAQDFGLQAAPGRSLAAKQGWMCCPDDRINLHSTGALGEQRRFVVALLSNQPAGRGYDGARETVTAAADAVRAALL